MDNLTLPIIDKMNAIMSIIITILSYVLGEHWILFAGYLFLNIADYVSGVINKRMKNEISSKKGLQGILKKLSYWIMIAVGFLLPALFIEIGEVIGVDLAITSCIGWFVLASLIINEVQSILENLIGCGINVPKVFTKGLKAAEKVLEDAEDITEE